jgi:ribosome biogenesis GTPase
MKTRSPHPDLDYLGWTPALAVAFAELGGQGLVPGRVVLEHNHVYRVLTRDGEHLAEVAGRLRHEAGGQHDLPAVGDWVAVHFGPGGARGTIRAILPRRSRFSRKVAGRETREQVVATNIDIVLIVFGLDAPMKPRGIERYLILARRSGARAVVVLNKSDLCQDVAGAVAEAAAVAGDVPVYAVSAHQDDRLLPLRQLLEAGRTLAVLGPSGAGKSSIVNRLVGRVVLPTGRVRERDARGRHTSVHKQLVVVESGGVIIDTPGLRELQLWETDDAVDDTFPEIASLGGACRFRDCRHDQEPGCAVKDAVAAGTLEGERYQSYLQLQRERAAFERKHDERAQLEAKRESKIVHRAMNRQQRDRDR